MGEALSAEASRPASASLRSGGLAERSAPVAQGGEGAAAGDASADPRVGVVTLTCNRAAEVAETTARLRTLPERPWLIVVDNASTDGTADVLRRRFPDLAYVRLPRNIGAAARNVGVRRCPRPFVALCDDDTWWEPGALRRAADLLEAHPRLAVVTARLLIGPQNREDSICRVMAASPLPKPPGLPGVPVLGFLAGATMVRRSAFLSVGGFAPRLFLGAEEHLLAMDLASAGWALAYVDDVVVHHYPSPRRDAQGRRLLLARNHLWIAWLRRPVGRALRETRRSLRAMWGEPGSGRTLLETLAGVPWALRGRRVAPPDVESLLRLIDPP